MPEPFTQLAQVAEEKQMPQERPCLPPEIAPWLAKRPLGACGGGGQWLRLGAARGGHRLHGHGHLDAAADARDDGDHRPGPAPCLAAPGPQPPRFSAGMSGDQLLVLQSLHAVEAAWGNQAQRAAAADVPLGSVHIRVKGCEW